MSELTRAERSYCRHCGDWVPHDAPSAICGRCACLPVAERGRRAPLPAREPGSDVCIAPDHTSECAPLTVVRVDHLDRWRALAAPFEPGEVRVRPQGARQLQYITARTVMNRLDNVLGPANWWDEYTPLENSVICRLTIRLPDGTTLTKSDAGGYAGMADSGDDDKSGFSDAFKRAAVKFGIGRYLYRDGVPRFAAVG